jgi:hypothetical protein
MSGGEAVSEDGWKYMGLKDQGDDVQCLIAVKRSSCRDRRELYAERRQ